MIPLGKQNLFSIWVVEVEVGVSLRTSQGYPDTTSRQDNGSCSRLPTLPGCRRRLGPYAIYVSDFKLFYPMSELTTYLLVICPKTAGNVFLRSHPRSVRIFSIIG